MRLYAPVFTICHALVSCPIWAATPRHSSSLMVSHCPVSILLTVAVLMPLRLRAALFWLPIFSQYSFSLAAICCFSSFIILMGI